jgi:hypothetical protein
MCLNSEAMGVHSEDDADEGAMIAVGFGRKARQEREA